MRIGDWGSDVCSSDLTIAFLTARGIPVMAHVGLTPQAVNALGGYRVQGRGDDAERILGGARAVAEAGAFSVVLAKVPEPMARRITGTVAIPTIGIARKSNRLNSRHQCAPRIPSS